MYTIHAFLDVSRTISAAATCVYFLGASLKQVETRRRNVEPFIWLLVAILLVSVVEATFMMVQSGGLPNIYPMAATLLHILGLLLQIDHLWIPSNEEKRLAWHALLGSWMIMTLFDMISIVEFATVSPSSTVDLVYGAVAVSLRFFLEIGLFIFFAWPDRGGFIQLTDHDVAGDTTIVSNHSNSRGGNRKKFLKRSIQDEIEEAGGTWPWVRKFRILLPWIWPSGMPWLMMLRIVAALLLRQVETALEVYTPYVNGAFMEAVARVYKDGNLIPLWKALMLLIGLRLVNSDVVISAAQDWLLLSFTQLRKMQAQNRIHEHLMNHEAAFHDVTSSNDINDASDMGVRFCDALDSLFLETVPQITQFSGTSITIFWLYGSHVALVGLTVTSIYALVSRRSNRMLMPIWDKRITAWQDTRRRREGGIKGWRTVVQHAQTSREIETYASSVSTYMTLVWKIQIFKISSRSCLRLIIILGESAMTALVILREVHIGGTVGSVVAFRGYWSLLQSPLLFFIRIPEDLMRDLYNADRLRRIMEVKPRMKYGSKDLHLAGGRIEFEAVTFGYTSANPVFKNLDLIIESGKTTAFVGPSGVGKTTLMDLILRHYDPQKGSIKIDGQDVRTLRKGVLSDHFAVMPQSPHLFNTTVGDNIKYGHPDATVSEIQRAAERAGIHSTITSLDDGYDAMVSEGGKNFSGGQRQRITLARTLMHSASVMLLDEATSALDADSETHVKETLEAEFAGKTIVIIAHRLSSVMHADKIIVFRKGEDGCGEIAEAGRHDELLKQDGIYARLWRKHIGVAGTQRERNVEDLFAEE